MNRTSMRIHAVGVAGLLAALGCSGGDEDPASRRPAEGPHLVLVAFDLPETAAAGATVNYTYTVRNEGNELSSAYALQLLMAHEDSPADQATPLEILPRPKTFEPRESDTREGTLRIPANLATGTFRVTARVLIDDSATVHPDRVRTRTVAVAGGACEHDAYEKDDRPEDARPIVKGETQDRNFCFDSSDWVRIEAEAGERFLVRLSTEMTPAPRIEIRPEAGGPSLAWTTNDRVLWQAEDAGNYLLHVGGEGTLFHEDQRLQRTGPGTDYVLELHGAIADLSAPYLSVLTSPVPAGGVATVLVRLQNLGWAIEEEIEAAIHLSDDPEELGERMATRYVSGLDAGAEQQPNWRFTVPADRNPGTYFVTVIVDPDGRVPTADLDALIAGPVPISVEEVACAPDAYEENDHPEDATPLPFQVAQSHNFCDDARDWFAIDARAGQGYQVFMAAASQSALRPRLELYDVDGTTRLLERDGWGSISLTFEAEATARYYLLATDRDSRFGSGLDYGIRIDPLLPDFTTTLNLSNLHFGVVRDGLIQAEVLVHNVGHAEAPASTAVIVMRPVAGGESRELLRLAVPAIPRGVYERLSWLLLPIPADVALGDWDVLAIADPEDEHEELWTQNNESEPTRVTVTDPPCAPDAYEPDDLPELASAIETGEAQQRNLCDDRIDWVRFEAQAGQGYVVETRFADIFTELLGVFDAEGENQVAGGPYTREKLYFQAERDGSHLIRIGNSPHPGGTNYDYTLTVDPCKQIPEVAVGSDDPIPMAPGDSLSHNFCTDWPHDLVFEASAGVTYTMETSELGTNVDPGLELYAPDGTRLASNWNIRQNDRNARIVWTAEVDGAHRLSVLTREWGLDSGYTITLTAD